MKKKVRYFLINNQFACQKINKNNFFGSSWFKNSFFLNFNNDSYNYFAKFAKKSFLKVSSQCHAKSNTLFFLKLRILMKEEAGHRKTTQKVLKITSFVN
jgi:hypothetical protein